MGKMMNIGLERYHNVIQQQTKSAGLNSLDILLVGATGVGKSSTINALLGDDVAKVGNSVYPETMNITAYCKGNLVIWDSAGLGDGIEQDIQHRQNIIKILSERKGKRKKIDLVMVIIDGSGRDLGTTYCLLEEVILPNFPENRIMILINQADMAMKGRHWDNDNMKPEPKLLIFLEEKAISVQKRLKETTGLNIDKFIYYSAEKKFNLDKIFQVIMQYLDKMIERAMYKKLAERRRNRKKLEEENRKKLEEENRKKLEEENRKKLEEENRNRRNGLICFSFIIGIGLLILEYWRIASLFFLSGILAMLPSDDRYELADLILENFIIILIIGIVLLFFIHWSTVIWYFIIILILIGAGF